MEPSFLSPAVPSLQGGGTQALLNLAGRVPCTPSQPEAPFVVLPAGRLTGQPASPPLCSMPSKVMKVVCSRLVSGSRAQRPVLPLPWLTRSWVQTLWAPGPFPGGRSPLLGTPPPGEPGGRLCLSPSLREVRGEGSHRPSAASSVHCPERLSQGGGERRSKCKGRSPAHCGNWGASVALGRGWEGRSLTAGPRALTSPEAFKKERNLIQLFFFFLLVFQIFSDHPLHTRD